MIAVAALFNAVAADESPADTPEAIIAAINVGEDGAYERLSEYCSSREYSHNSIEPYFELIEEKKVHDTAETMLETGYGDAILDGLKLLAERGTKKDAKLVKPWLYDSNGAIVGKACKTYGAFDEGKAYKDTRKALKKAEPETAAILVGYMGESGNTKAPDDIEKYIRKTVEENGWDDEEYENLYRTSLWYMNQGSNKDILIEALDNEKRSFIHAAVKSLCEINDPETLIPIIDRCTQPPCPVLNTGYFAWNEVDETAARYAASKLGEDGTYIDYELMNNALTILFAVAPPDKLSRVMSIGFVTTKTKEEILKGVYERALHRPYRANSFVEKSPDTDIFRSVNMISGIDLKNQPEYKDLTKFYAENGDWRDAKIAAEAVLRLKDPDDLEWAWGLIGEWSKKVCESEIETKQWRGSAYNLFRRFYEFEGAATPFIEEGLRFEDEDIVLVAVSLANRINADLDEEISALLFDANPRIKEAALKYYVKNDLMTPELYSRFFEDTNNEVRYKALLYSIRDNNDPDILRSFTNDDDIDIRMSALARLAQVDFESAKPDIDEFILSDDIDERQKELMGDVIIKFSPDKYDEEYLAYLASEDVGLQTFALSYALSRGLISEDLRALFLSALDEDLPENQTRYIFKNWYGVMGTERIEELPKFLGEYPVKYALLSSPKEKVWPVVYKIAENKSFDEGKRRSAVRMLARLADYDDISQLEALRPLPDKLEKALEMALKRARWNGGIEKPK